MRISEDFADLLEAKVFLVSGFNAMSEALLVERLESVEGTYEAAQRRWCSMRKRASMSRTSRLIHAQLAGKIDIVSLNEDEMQGYLGGKLDLLMPRRSA